MDPVRQQELLAQLRGLELPEPPGLWPLAPGWWLLLALCLLLLGGFFLLRRWRRNTWKKEARREFQRIASSARDTAEARARVLQRTSTLLRRVALAVQGRSRVAALTDEAWLETLDALAGGQSFSSGPGLLLTRHPYMPPERIPTNELEQLLELTDQTLRAVKPGVQTKLAAERDSVRV